MTAHKTPEQIAEETLRHEYGLTVEDYPTAEEAMQKVLDVADDQTAADLLDTIAKAIEADRAQKAGMEDEATPKRRPTLWIDTRGEPVVTHSANGEENAIRWGWVRAEAVPMLDPEPWHCPGADPKYRIKHGEQLQCDEFTPRPGYSQNREDYT